MTLPVIFDEVHRKRYFQKILGLDRANLIAYWPLGEVSGNDALDLSPEGNDGTYIGVTLGQTGIGDGKTCPSFDGSNDQVDVYSVGFRNAFSAAAGTVAGWIKVSAVGNWTDASSDSALGFGVNGDNQIYFQKTLTDNRFDVAYKAGGTFSLVGITGLSDIDWMHFAISWNVADDKVKAYKDGSQNGSTQTGLGTWVGNLVSTRCVIGDFVTTPNQPWAGFAAHVAVWKSTLSVAKILKLATV